MNLLCFLSDKFQEYKQKHLERKAAVVKELGLKLPNELLDSETVKGQKSSAKETGCGKEAEDGGSPAVERKSQQEQPLEEVSVERLEVVSASDHVLQPVEPIQHEETEVDRQHSEDSEKGTSDAEMKVKNGESQVRAAGQETETSVQNVVKSSTANGEMKSEAKCDEMKSDETNCEINRTGVLTANASVLKSKGTWADVVVSKAFIANGTAHKEPAVNGVAHISANGTAEE